MDITSAFNGEGERLNAPYGGTAHAPPGLISVVVNSCRESAPSRHQRPCRAPATPRRRRLPSVRIRRTSCRPASGRGFVENINGLRMHVLEAGFETPGPAGGAAASRLPGAGVQLAQGDGADRRRRLSRVSRPTCAATDAHQAPTSRYDDDLAPFRIAEPGARHAGAGVGVRAIARCAR